MQETGERESSVKLHLIGIHRKFCTQHTQMVNISEVRFITLQLITGFIYHVTVLLVLPGKAWWDGYEFARRNLIGDDIIL